MTRPLKVSALLARCRVMTAIKAGVNKTLKRDSGDEVFVRLFEHLSPSMPFMQIEAAIRSRTRESSLRSHARSLG